MNYKLQYQIIVALLLVIVSSCSKQDPAEMWGSRFANIEEEIANANSVDEIISIRGEIVNLQNSDEWKDFQKQCDEGQIPPEKYDEVMLVYQKTNSNFDVQRNKVIKSLLQQRGSIDERVRAFQQIINVMGNELPRETLIDLASWIRNINTRSEIGLSNEPYDNSALNMLYLSIIHLENY